MGVRIACLAVGYVFGLFQTGYLLGRYYGIDIRNYGSGNAGTTNMLRTKGKMAGLITFAGDCVKCVLAMLRVQLLFRKTHGDMVPLLKIYAAAGVILGHNYPFYLNFRGGKGIAATAGFLVGFDWVMTLLEAAIFLATFFTTHYVSLGSLLVYAGLMAELVIFGQMGRFGMSQGHLIELYVVGGLLTALAFWKHRANIGRLIRGEENKTLLSSKSS